MADRNKISRRLFSLLILGIVLSIVVVVNIIFSTFNQRIDMTEDQRFSLAQGTREFLDESENFKGRLNIKIYLAGNLPAELEHFREAIEDKLKEFKTHAGDRIEYQFIDPHVGTEEEKEELFQNIFAEGRGILPMNVVYNQDGAQNQLLLWPGAIIEYGGSTTNTVQLLPGTKTNQPFQLNGMEDMIQNSMNNLEYMLISSIRRATQDRKPRIAFLQGHGELEFKETQRVRALISPYFAITDVALNDSIHALDDVDGLIIARPRTRFSDKDLYIIDQFVMRGGRLMCFMDRLYMPEDTLAMKGEAHTVRYNLGLDRMLFDYGLKVQDNYIIDAQCAPKQVPLVNKSAIPWFFHVLGTPSSHPISRNVEPISLEYTSEVQFVGNDPNIALTPILTTSTNATSTGMAPLVSLLMPINYGENPELVPNPDSESNKKCLAGLAEGKFESYFKNRIVGSFANNPDSKYLEKSSKEGKVFVIGNGRFIANAYDSMPSRRDPNVFMYRPTEFNNLQYSRDMASMNIRHYFGNQEFFQNLTDYMMGANSVLDIRSRQIDIHAIDKEKVKEEASFMKVLNIGLPILIILLMALFLYRIRRIKYTSIKGTDRQIKRARMLGYVTLISGIFMLLSNLLFGFITMMTISAVIFVLLGILFLYQARYLKSAG